MHDMAASFIVNMFNCSIYILYIYCGSSQRGSSGVFLHLWLKSIALQRARPRRVQAFENCNSAIFPGRKCSRLPECFGGGKCCRILKFAVFVIARALEAASPGSPVRKFVSASSSGVKKKA